MSDAEPTIRVEVGWPGWLSQRCLICGAGFVAHACGVARDDFDAVRGCVCPSCLIENERQVGYVYAQLHERAERLHRELELLAELTQAEWELPSVSEWMAADAEVREWDRRDG